MKDLLYKELRLATPLLTILFLGFTVMTFLPGYPILCGAFFVCLGIFQSYQLGRADHDILYTVLLPVRKRDVVLAKYGAAVALQLAAFLLFALFTGIRMTLLAESAVYRANVLMGANPVFLAFVLLIFAAFNTVFLGGFFKTAYHFGKPFVLFSVTAFLLIGVGETLHHLPGLAWLNTLDLSCMGRQTAVLAATAVLYFGVTAVSCRRARLRFETLDL